MASQLREQINRYGTFDDKLFIEAEKQQSKTEKKLKKEVERERKAASITNIKKINKN